MFLDGQLIDVTISNNGSYYRSVGFSVEETRQGQRIKVALKDLQKNSNKEVACLCDSCEKDFTRSFQILNRAPTHLCSACSYELKMKLMDRSKTAKVAANRTGPLHPRFNTNKTAFNEYRRKVFSFTRKNDLKLLENHDKPRGICGVDGVFQLDHIISIKHGFDNGFSAETIGNITNLRFIPWKENRSKGATVLNNSSLL